MWRLWAVARHTIRQCLRMKVAALFIVLLGGSLLAMPFMDFLKGDGTLAGQIQTFLIYASGMTAALLSLMTVFLSTGMVSGDVRSRQIFSVATKPVARWQYVIGRWLGMVVLNAILVAIAGLGIYGSAQYLRAGQALQTSSGRAEDRRKVETEVFTARLRVAPDQVLDVDRAARDRIENLKKEGRYDAVRQAFIDANNGNVAEGEAQFLRELTSQVLAEVETVVTGRMITWTFSGAQVAGKEFHGQGIVADRSEEPPWLVVRADRRVVGKLIYDGPVWVNGVIGRAVRIDPDRFTVLFSPDDMSVGPVATVKQGHQVAVLADPTVQITYKARSSIRTADGNIPSFWEIENPTDHWLYYLRRNDVADVPATLTVPARVVDAGGKMVVRFVNMAPGNNAVTVRQADVAVLYRVGEFGPNLARGFALILVELAFLSALGVLAGTFTSFPVACLFCFSMLPFQVARTFLLEAVSSPAAKGGSGLLLMLNQLVIRGMNRLLPDFGSTFPGRPLVDGLYISWEFLGTTAFWTLCVQTAILLAVACAVFRKRELARAQV